MLMTEVKLRVLRIGVIAKMDVEGARVLESELYRDVLQHIVKLERGDMSHDLVLAALAAVKIVFPRWSSIRYSTGADNKAMCFEATPPKAVGSNAECP